MAGEVAREVTTKTSGENLSDQVERKLWGKFTRCCKNLLEVNLWKLTEGCSFDILAESYLFKKSFTQGVPL